MHTQHEYTRYIEYICTYLVMDKYYTECCIYSSLTKERQSLTFGTQSVLKQLFRQ